MRNYNAMRRRRTGSYLPTVWGCNSKSGLGNLMNIGDTSVPVSDAAMQVVGMIIAVVSGSSLNWVINKLNLFKENVAVRNLIMSIAGTGIALKLPALLRLIGMDSVATSLETNPSLNNMLKGATTMFGFAVAMSGVGLLSEKTGISLPFIASETNLLSQINQSTGTTSGIFGEGDYSAKIANLKESLTEAESSFAAVPSTSDYDKQEVMSYVRNMLGYAKINISNAEAYLSEGKYSLAEKDMAQAKEYILTTKAFLAGMTTAVVPAETTIPVAQPGEVVLENTDTGEQIAVVAPAEPVEVPVDAGGQTAGAFSVELIEGWANYIAPQLGWTPAQVISSYLLRYLANNGYVWAYGRNPVQAYMPTTSGADATAYVTYNNSLYEVNSYDGVVDLVRTIKGY